MGTPPLAVAQNAEEPESDPESGVEPPPSFELELVPPPASPELDAELAEDDDDALEDVDPPLEWEVDVLVDVEVEPVPLELLQPETITTAVQNQPS